jgi:hypothetical protein
MVLFIPYLIKGSKNKQKGKRKGVEKVGKARKARKRRVKVRVLIDNAKPRQCISMTCLRYSRIVD